MKERAVELRLEQLLQADGAAFERWRLGAPDAREAWLRWVARPLRRVTREERCREVAAWVGRVPELRAPEGGSIVGDILGEVFLCAWF